MSATANRVEWWERFAGILRAKMRDDLHEKLKALDDPHMGEEEFLQALDQMTDMVKKNADCVRPQVWAYVLSGFATATTNEMRGGNPCPPLNEPLTP